MGKELNIKLPETKAKYLGFQNFQRQYILFEGSIRDVEKLQFSPVIDLATPSILK